MNIDKYAPVGTKHCEGICDIKILPTINGVVVICEGCKRIVVDRRK
jgi:hypothetical protein